MQRLRLPATVGQSICVYGLSTKLRTKSRNGNSDSVHLQETCNGEANKYHNAFVIQICPNPSKAVEQPNYNCLHANPSTGLLFGRHTFFNVRYVSLLVFAGPSLPNPQETIRAITRLMASLPHPQCPFVFLFLSACFGWNSSAFALKSSGSSSGCSIDNYLRL